MSRSSRRYWDAIAGAYQGTTRIRVDDFHYGPLVPGDRELGLLPPALAGCRCLELGCGGAQNSMYLARQGAACVACDLSGEQLAAARKLSREHCATVDLVQTDLDQLPFRPGPRFDLIHSCYALPFVQEPERVVREAALRLVPGGVFLLSTSHPLAMGEWVELDEGETGVFTRNYFHPDQDWRQEGDAEEICRAVPVSELFDWCRAAGLVVERLLEPRPPPRNLVSDRRLREQAPYSSEEWLERRDELSRIPFLVVIRAIKP